MTQQIIALNQKKGYVDKILPHLYLGDIETSQNELLLNDLNIKCIINLSNEENDKYTRWQGMEYLDVTIDDSKNVDISMYFENCWRWIENHRNQGKNILVHCMCGVSRSVTILLSYLIKYGLSLKEAFHHIKTIRTRQYTCPNIGFFKQLQKYEEKLTEKETSMTLQEYIKERNNGF